jgi:hypothetical protein
MSSGEKELQKEYHLNANDNVKSYTSASGLPWKLLQNKGSIIDGRIRPIHIQFSPTNNCNANCKWCSCSGVDRELEMGIDEIEEMLEYFAAHGTKAITITGGGEPTLHPDIRKILLACKKNDIHVGLVTNGLLWGKPDANITYADDLITWIRMSTVRPDGKPRPDRVINLCRHLPNVAIGVSFTVPKDVNIDAAIAICQVANGLPNLTHIRFVSDILNPDDATMVTVKEACDGLTDKAIFQTRSKFTRGMNPCYISKLKPYIDADGEVYPCCGVQYAIPSDLRRLPPRFKMGNWRDFCHVPPFDGSICQVCYYEQYNLSIKNMTEPIQHERFV